MAKITKLERQKYKNSRVSVFVDGEYAFSLSDDAVIDHGLSVGTDVNSLPLEEIAKEDEYKRALAKSFELLSARDKTKKQLADNLRRNGYSQEAIEKTTERLTELDYIDDFAYAKRFAENSKDLGKRGIEYKLRERGIDGQIISRVLEDVDEDVLLENAKALVEKNIKKYEKYPVRERKMKLSQMLARKGFDWEKAKEAIDSFEFEEEE